MFRLWYNLFTMDKAHESKPKAEREPGGYAPLLQSFEPPRRYSGVAYAESKNGIVWNKTGLGLVEYKGSKANNLIRYHSTHGAGMMRDAHDNNSTRRYKMFYKYNAEIPGEEGLSMAVNFSPDGIHWGTRHLCGAIEAAGDTHNNAIWAPTLTKYVGITRLWDEVRQVGRTESPDFVNWSKAEVELQGKEAHLQTYAMPIFYYCGVYLGLPVIFNTEEDRAHTELAWSPDTRKWHRILPGTPLIPNSPKKGAYDWGCVYPSKPVFLDDEIRLYYGGSNYKHTDWREGFLCLATLRPDGFAGYRPLSKETTALIVTELVRVSGDTLRISADVSKGGSVQVEIAEADGFTFKQCTPVTGSVTDAPVLWRTDADLSALSGQAVQIRFRMDNATLYAFGFGGRGK